MKVCSTCKKERKHTLEPVLSQIKKNKLGLSCVSRFINARRRILQPMLDASSSETPKTKKKTPQNRPLQRFWPDSIATGGATHQQVTMPDGMQLCFLCTVFIKVTIMEMKINFRFRAHAVEESILRL